MQCVIHVHNQLYIYLTYRGGGLQLLLKRGADVAEQSCAFFQAFDLLAADGVSLADIGPEAAAVEGEAVAIGQFHGGRGGLQYEAVGGKALYTADILSTPFCCPLAPFSVQE